MTMYSCGLRRSEVVSLKVENIDSDRMLIHIINSKYGKNRYVLLSESLLVQLRLYWHHSTTDKTHWFFPSKDPQKKIPLYHPNLIFKTTLKKTNINKKVSCHSLRHSWATHMLEDGLNLRYLQILLGHSSINSTAIYTQLINYHNIKTKSPLDIIFEKLTMGGSV